MAKPKAKGWSVPREWEGETAFILGGGPSLAKVDVAALRGRGRVIAINDAGLTVAPWADVHYAADRVWYKWPHNQARLGNFQGRYRVTRQTPPPLPVAYDVKVMAWEASLGLSRNPTKVAGRCGGSHATNLAFLFGARRIVLLGFDMRAGSWHGQHRRKVSDNIYVTEYLPAFARMAVELTREGVRVINATPGSALKCFPIMPLEAIMAGDDEGSETATEERPKASREKPAPRAAEVLGARRGASITEFGPFDPSVARTLKMAGLKVLVVTPDDFGSTPGVAVERAQIYALPKTLPVSDYGVCETLAERVPPPRIEQAIADIAAKVGKAAYFRIGTRPARGPRVTRRGALWWQGKLGQAFRTAALIAEDDGIAEFVCRHD